jgi:hypothetical protein
VKTVEKPVAPMNPLVAAMLRKVKVSMAQAKAE